MNDTIHPKYYKLHASGIECIQVIEHMPFNIGNAVKYLWRFEDKGGDEDLRKAIWYIERELSRREGKAGAPQGAGQKRRCPTCFWLSPEEDSCRNVNGKDCGRENDFRLWMQR